MDNQEQEYISYKINTKLTYKVYVNESYGKRFYKVLVTKKNVDGTKTKFYKQLNFVKCTPPENGEIIRIKKGFEDLYTNTKDPYNPISVIVVMDYEKEENQQVREEQAYASYHEKLNESEEVDIDESFLD